MTPIVTTACLGSINRLARPLFTRLADRAYVSVQNPLRLDGVTEPQPDLVVARGSEDDYADRHLEAVSTSCSSSRSPIPRCATTLRRRCLRYCQGPTYRTSSAGGRHRRRGSTVYTTPGPGGYAHRAGLPARAPRSLSTMMADLLVTVDEIFCRVGRSPPLTLVPARLRPENRSSSLCLRSESREAAAPRSGRRPWQCGGRVRLVAIAVVDTRARGCRHRRAPPLDSVAEEALNFERTLGRSDRIKLSE